MSHMLCCLLLCLFNTVRENFYTRQSRQYQLQLYWTMSHMLCCLVPCLFNTIRDKSIHDNRGSNSCSCIELCLLCCFVLRLFNTIRDKSINDNRGSISYSFIELCHITWQSKQYQLQLYWTMSHIMLSTLSIQYNTWHVYTWQ
jgi:hypothetical protein